MPAAVFHPLRVAGVDQLTDDSAAVTFDVPPHLAGEYAFAAGQSLTLRRVIDGAEHRRSYSICAPAGARPRIGVREIPGGLFSSWLVREVRRRWPEVGIIVLTAAHDTDAARDCLAAGAHHFFLKPIKIEEFHHVLETASRAYQVQREAAIPPPSRRAAQINRRAY